jgi:hypothetical protein
MVYNICSDSAVTATTASPSSVYDWLTLNIAICITSPQYPMKAINLTEGYAVPGKTDSLKMFSDYGDPDL